MTGADFDAEAAAADVVAALRPLADPERARRLPGEQAARLRAAYRGPAAR